MVKFIELTSSVDGSPVWVNPDRIQLFHGDRRHGAMRTKILLVDQELVTVDEAPHVVANTIEALNDEA